METKTYLKVYYSDTDAYGVAWHGSYLRWMEIARVDFCEKSGAKMSDLERKNVILPVRDIKISYKKSARLEDELVVETKIDEITRLSFTFKQIIKNSKTDEVYVVAFVKVVAVDKEGKLYKELPEVLKELIK